MLIISVLEQVKNSKFVYFGFEAKPTEENVWNAIPAICTSEDGINFNVLKYIPEFGVFRDGYIQRIGDDYFLLGTLGIYHTKDFINFDAVPQPFADRSDITNVWAPKMFQGKDGNYHIILTCHKWGTENREVYVFDFDPATFKITNDWQQVAIECGEDFDSNIKYLNGQYFMFMKNDDVYVSDSYLGPFTKYDTNLTAGTNAQWYEEGPDLCRDNENIYLYYDRNYNRLGLPTISHLVRRVALSDDLKIWSDPIDTQCSFPLRHGSFLVNEQEPQPESYFPAIKSDSSFGTVVL